MTGQPYPDVAGSTTDENNFLRSYSNDTYLWYNEISDRDPSLYSDPLDYFDLLVTTPTGDVGYMVFNDHIATAEQALIDAVNQLNSYNGGQGIDDLVLDLRYNGGGYLAIASEFAFMIAGPTRSVLPKSE